MQQAAWATSNVVHTGTVNLLYLNCCFRLPYYKQLKKTRSMFVHSNREGQVPAFTSPIHDSRTFDTKTS